MTTPAAPVPATIDATLSMLAAADYVAERSLATAVFLALRMGRPLFLEGEAGVGKTEIAKVLRAVSAGSWSGCSVTKVWTSLPRSTNGTTRGR